MVPSGNRRSSEEPGGKQEEETLWRRARSTTSHQPESLNSFNTIRLLVNIIIVFYVKI